jgi:hypothetical protein
MGLQNRTLLRFIDGIESSAGLFRVHRWALRAHMLLDNGNANGRKSSSIFYFLMVVKKKRHFSKWFSEFVASIRCTTQGIMIITIHSLASPSISERICCVLFLLSVDIDFRSISPELQTEKLGHASDGSRENHTERAGQGSNRNEKA